ncbi:hypothetical protein HFE03_07900 [Paenibacillus sp. EKM102P]|uniref:hypothetical protein n=1 Tax=unclassified Paenibacillus TaxID=185978 RepID=UPI00142DB8A9|nr:MULTISPECIES: hypothetical protein [unclassified Paenibacillus]KAF6620567.1 hypothetical protein HFE00_05805 [Paenibacillus sp. EKM101P]KAF6623559.1 hypothetical protein HFE03_07900 [Paenibacillus sp. EKM102P]KAF6633879.1 hypothetical protein HFE01_06610 [Paenibacillus sp. EKM10P]KAF6649405.1 hypothetical protein HFE02_01570 [Paenibacillus sp. EKM11P]
MTKIAMVKHNGNSKEYAFKTDINLNIGDLVVCDTANGYETGRVQNITDQDYWATKRWIVSRIDTKSHVERVKKEKKISELNQQIEMRRNEYEGKINDLIAQHDKVMFDLLDELNELTNTNNRSNDIELKDSFYFKNQNGFEYYATKLGDKYSIVHVDTLDTYEINVKTVKKYISKGEWRIIKYYKMGIF